MAAIHRNPDYAKMKACFLNLGHEIGLCVSTPPLQASGDVFSALMAMNENLTQMNHKISGLEVKVSDLDCKVSNLDCKVSNLDCKVSDLDCKVSVLDCKVSDLDCKVSVLDCKVSRLDGEMKTVQEVVDREMKAVERAVNGLYQNVQAERHNNVARILNSRVTNMTLPMSSLVGLVGETITPFPITPGDLYQMDVGDLDKILQGLGLSTAGEPAQKRDLILVHCGVVNINTNPALVM